MSRPAWPRVLVVTVLILVVGLPGRARADGWFFGVGAGGGTNVGGELATVFSGEGQAHGRFVGGRRLGALAIEASFFGTDLVDRAGAMHATFALGLGARAFVPLTGWLELYARGGLDKTWLRPAFDGTHAAGRGVDYGAGLQVRTRVGGLVAAGLWLDVGGQVVRLHQEGGPALDGKLGMVNVGFSVGGDL